MTLSKSRSGTRKSAEVRARRKAFREMLKQKGQLSTAEILNIMNENRGYIQSMRVEYLLKSLPGIGPVKAGRIMDELEISRSRRIRGLGARQKRALVELLPKYTTKVRD